MKRYDPATIEPKWQQIWDETQVYKADLNSEKPKYIAMSMFNYPSGNGIHIGHAMNYTISDVMARFKRQQGYESYHPVGWDAFGLPAENYAIKTGVSPQESMATIIPSYHTQYKAMGWSNDWSKEISTHAPEYYKWTQWIFSEMYRQGLAYQDARMQWWCTKCQTVLANEQVLDGKCWRHDAADDPDVAKKEVKQWFFKITDYADEMLEATDGLDWSDVVKTAQKNWIGKSVGAEVEFAIDKPTAASQEPTEFRSYIMGQKNITSADIEAIGGKVVRTTDAGHLCVTFPRQSAVQFEELIAEKMESGFWNEYIGDNIVFIFKDKNGNTSRIVRDDEHESEILKLCEDYADTQFENIEQMLKGNSWYENFLPKSKIQNPKSTITVFTTRPDTLYGVTFLVLAPEHELVEHLVTPETAAAVKEYVTTALKKTELERQVEGKEKTGVFTGSYAVNPLTKEPVPVWVADYVLGGYGTGAIMAVPAHDERDNEFARKFDLPIKEVIAPDFGAPLPDAVDVQGPVVIGYDPNTKRFMSLWNTKYDKRWLVGGGLNDGEDYEAAALRELKEEAGYSTIRQLIRLGGPTYSYYFNSNKNSNRRSFSYMFLAIIDEKEVALQELEANESYTVDWTSHERILQDFVDRPDGVTHWIDGMERAKQAALEYDAGKEYIGPVFHDDGVLFHSGPFSGASSAEARELIVQHLEREGKGRAKTTYKIRDWSVSRQRYWGAPIPIVNCGSCGQVLVPDDQLPVELPLLDDYAPSGDGRSALARATEWLKTECPQCGGPGERETDTLDTYICSSWYELRYFDPKNSDRPFDPAVVNKWMPIDFYNGGDHATAHLIYVRFVARFFHKLGLLDNPEPFKKFLFNGKVTAGDGTMFSKSKGNGVDPLEIINQGYGADALRTYLMFAAPLDLWIRWDPQGVPGTHRFLSRVWNLVQEYGLSSQQATTASRQRVLQITHRTIKKVTEDLEQQKYNTAIAAMMKATNELYEEKATNGLMVSDEWQFALTSLVALVAPFAPHMADELWHQLGNDSSVQRDSWPKWDKVYLVSATLMLAVQVNGKVRATIEVPTEVTKEELERLALENSRVQEYLDGKKPTRVIVVPGRLVNVVV